MALYLEALRGMGRRGVLRNAGAGAAPVNREHG